MPIPAPHHEHITVDGHGAAVRPVWTAERIRRLGMVTDITTAGAILGLSRSVAYELARTGQFPVPVLRAGTRYRVPVPAILAALHLPAEPPDRGADDTTTAAT